MFIMHPLACAANESPNFPIPKCTMRQDSPDALLLTPQEVGGMHMHTPNFRGWGRSQVSLF